jgi:hypothetical protein
MNPKILNFPNKENQDYTKASPAVRQEKPSMVPSNILYEVYIAGMVHGGKPFDFEKSEAIINRLLAKRGQTTSDYNDEIPRSKT